MKNYQSPIVFQSIIDGCLVWSIADKRMEDRASRLPSGLRAHNRACVALMSLGVMGWPEVESESVLDAEADDIGVQAIIPRHRWLRAHTISLAGIRIRVGT
jgi:hypothetical protein